MQVEAIEKNKMKLTFAVDAAKFEEGLRHSYNKNKGHFTIPGFRKGKTPRKVIEMHYGKEVFYEDAVNHILGDAYEAALKESGLDIVSRPEIDMDSISTEEGVVFTAEVFVKPEVAVSDYMGIAYQKTEVVVSEAEVDAEIEAARKQNARLISVSDRAAQDGDIVIIDFDGSVDGVPFEGGQSEDHSLKLGSGTFIPGFEPQIAGHHVGDDFDVHVTFPEAYHAEDLAGKEAVFAVEIKDIQTEELPELNDEFAQDISEFDTLAEYRDSLRATLQKRGQDEADAKKENDVLRGIIEKAVMDVPDIMIDNRVEEMFSDQLHRMRHMGIAPDMYLRMMGQTPEMLKATLHQDAELQVKARLVLEAIAKIENIEATAEEVDAEIAKMAEAYGMETEKLHEILSEEERKSLETDVCTRKALDLVMGAAIEMEILEVKA